MIRCAVVASVALLAVAGCGRASPSIASLTSTAHDLDRGADPLTTIKTLQHRLAPVEADDVAAWRTLGVPACVNR
jgi:hypothetical protein